MRIVMPQKKNYFVRHLPLDDTRRSKGHQVQIQLVDKYGRALAFVYASSTDLSVDLGGAAVPNEVLRAARLLDPGRSEFVRSSGEVMSPRELLD
jgi:hypothetical protein